MTVVAIIPARGGSKRIPRKNIKPFAGKPMIAHSITAAKASGVFDRIVVSTDDREISEVAVAWGAEVPFMRPAELANDFASTEDVLVHDLLALGAGKGQIQYACCLYATAPMVQPGDIKRGFEIIRTSNAATAFTVTSFDYPIFRALRMNSKTRLEMVWPEHLNTRSQDLPEVMHDAGQFYWMNVKKFLTEKQLFSCDAAPISIPRWRVQDIDTEDDWIRAENMFRALGGSP